MKERIIQLLFLFTICFNSFGTKTDIDYYDNNGLSYFLKENLQTEEVDFLIDKLRKVNITESDSKELLNNLINIVERYVYLDIIKYPSQPKENYFNIVDLVEKLKNVTTAERPIYGLFREINLIISEYQDNHFSFSYNRGILQGYKLSEMFFISPI